MVKIHIPMVSLLATLNSQFPLCHTIFTQIVLTGCKQLYYGSGTLSKKL